jgi:predicted lipoprotein with Yx(FWY)xxD motif
VGLSRLFGVALVAATVAGCATSTCTGDPRTDNVWCADKGLTSGDYERDTEAMASTLADQEKKAKSERAKGQQLRARLAALRTRRQRIERELTAMLARLNRRAQQRPGQEARIASLRAEIAKALEGQRAARARLDEQIRRIEGGKAAESVKAAAAEEKVVITEEAAVLSDERGMRLFAQQVDEVTRT